MKKLFIILFIVFLQACHSAGGVRYKQGVIPVPNPPMLDEPENCAQFEKELDFKKPYMMLAFCSRGGDVGNPLSITYFVLGKYGKKMEQDLIEKFNLTPLKHSSMDTWGSKTILDNYYSDERVLVILVGMTDWGAKTREEWHRPTIQFSVTFYKYPYPW